MADVSWVIRLGGSLKILHAREVQKTLVSVWIETLVSCSLLHLRLAKLVELVQQIHSFSVVELLVDLDHFFVLLADATALHGLLAVRQQRDYLGDTQLG